MLEDTELTDITCALAFLMLLVVLKGSEEDYNVMYKEEREGGRCRSVFVASSVTKPIISNAEREFQISVLFSLLRCFICL
jgi:hypothetical protein